VAEYIFRGQDFLNYVFKKVLLDKTQFGDAQKYLGWHCPRMPPRSYGPVFYTTKTPLVTGAVTKMQFFGSNSQVYQEYRVYYRQIFKAGQFLQRSIALLFKETINYCVNLSSKTCERHFEKRAANTWTPDSGVSARAAVVSKN